MGWETADVWTGVDRLVARAPTFDDLRAHRLHLLAIDFWKRSGQAESAEHAMEELYADARERVTTAVLERARDAYGDQIMVIKGAAVAARYPRPTLRPASDIDVLVRDPERAYRDLLAVGFIPAGTFEDDYYRGLQHLRPLVLPDLMSMAIEVHVRPSWVPWAEVPQADRLFERAIPSSLAVDGLLEPDPEDHALMLAAHSWASAPLRRLSDLVDIAVVGREADHAALAAVAAEWGLERLWETVLLSVDAVLLDRGDPLALRLWARNLRQARDRTVFETHLRRWLGPFWALNWRRAATAATRALYEDLTPAPSESWSNKLRRARTAIGNARQPTAQHYHDLGPERSQPRHLRRDW